MRQAIVLLTGAAMLQGCALPVGVQMASWAVDGMVLLATDKTVTDHGLSLVTQKDCKLWRTVEGDDICIESIDDGGPVLVQADTAGPDGAGPSWRAPVPDHHGAGDAAVSDSVATSAPAVTGHGGMGNESPGDAPPAVAAFETAAGGTAQDPLPAADPESETPAEDGRTTARYVVPVAPGRSERSAAAALPGLAHRDTDGAQDAGRHYFVIGSFRLTERAHRLSGRHQALDPVVVRAQAKGHTVYRVMVGPFTGSQRDERRTRLTAAGVGPAWVITSDAADLHVIDATVPEATQVAQVARAPM